MINPAELPKLEMTHIFQEQVCGCIYHTRGCHIKKQNGKLVMHQKVS